MSLIKKNKPFVFEGVAAEQYKQMRNKWIRLAIVSVLLPLISAAVVACYNNTLDVLELFGNGEVILSLFSLTIPMLFDLFEMKKKNDEHLSWAFFFCIILVCFQLLFYCVTRLDNSKYKELRSIIVSGVALILSLSCCGYSIKAIFQHSISDNGGEDNEI